MVAWGDRWPVGTSASCSTSRHTFAPAGADALGSTGRTTHAVIGGMGPRTHQPPCSSTPSAVRSRRRQQPTPLDSASDWTTLPVWDTTAPPAACTARGGPDARSSTHRHRMRVRVGVGVLRRLRGTQLMVTGIEAEGTDPTDDAVVMAARVRIDGVVSTRSSGPPGGDRRPHVSRGDVRRQRQPGPGACSKGSRPGSGTQTSTRPPRRARRHGARPSRSSRVGEWAGAPSRRRVAGRGFLSSSTTA